MAHPIPDPRPHHLSAHAWMRWGQRVDSQDGSVKRVLKRLKQAHYRGRRWSPEDGRLLVGWQWEGWVFVHDVGRDHVRTVWPAAWFERLPYAERGGIG